MKRTAAWVASLALNLLLLGLLLRTGGQSPRVASNEPPADPASGAISDPVDPVPGSPADGEAPPFHWSQLDQSDWVAYREGLLEIGCPATTVREILEPGVRRQFAVRVRELAAPYGNRFWELALSEGEEAFEELKQSVEALEAEQKQLLEELFANLPTGNDASPAQDASSVAALDFLAPSVRERLVELQAAHREEMRRIHSNPLDGDDAQEARVAGLQQRHELEISALLTPEEEDQWKLRTSRFAHLRNLEGISLTEEELAGAIRIQERAVGQTNGSGRSAMVALLGEERASDLERARDDEFQTLLRMSDRLGATADQARALWELEREMRELADAAQRDVERPEAERLADLEGLRQHLASSAQTILGGARGRAMWEHTRRGWLDQAFRMAEDDPLASPPQSTTEEAKPPAADVPP